MRAPDLEEMIAEGEQEALLDFGYEYVVALVRPVLRPIPRTSNDYLHDYLIDSNTLHGEVGRMAATGELPADDVSKVYDAIWSIKRALQERHNTNQTCFSAQQWDCEARAQSSRLDNSKP